MLPLIAVALIPLLALLGGGIDMTRAYLAENRLQDACDAGIYGALKKLTSTSTAGALPADAQTLGNTMFKSNFRDGDYSATATAFAMTVSSNKTIDGTASATVPNTVMKIFGKDQVDISASCSAPMPVATGKNIDVMFVLENTASIGLNYDGMSKIAAIRNAIKSFYQQLETAKQPSSRIRYGFVPFSGNVSVTFLLKPEWLKTYDYYQSREKVYYVTDGWAYAVLDWINFTYISGSMVETPVESYPATFVESPAMTYQCPKALPTDSMNTVETLLSTTTEPVTNPTATKTTKRKRRVYNGTRHFLKLEKGICNVVAANYSNYTEEFDEITGPKINWGSRWSYKKILHPTFAQKITNGCIKERDTYEIQDFNAIDFTRAIDLDIDRVPDSESSKWSEAQQNYIYQRANTDATGSTFSLNNYETTANFYQPTSISNCPVPARKLAEMSAAEVDTYLNSLRTSGNYSYPDVGMIWGARLLSPTGIFADENADLPGGTTARHLIYVADGGASTNISSVSAYGSDWIDRFRRHPTAPYGGRTLNTVVDLRLQAACREAKKRNITVWAISYGAAISTYPRDCVGTGYWFNLYTVAQLNDTFTQIANTINGP